MHGDPRARRGLGNGTTGQVAADDFYALGVGDIVAVNGQPAKGIVAFRAWGFLMKPAPDPGGAIAWVPRQAQLGHARRETLPCRRQLQNSSA
jgi:hypothetical protein